MQNSILRSRGVSTKMRCGVETILTALRISWRLIPFRPVLRGELCLKRRANFWLIILRRRRIRAIRRCDRCRRFYITSSMSRRVEAYVRCGRDAGFCQRSAANWRCDLLATTRLVALRWGEAEAPRRSESARRVAANLESWGVLTVVLHY